VIKIDGRGLARSGEARIYTDEGAGSPPIREKRRSAEAGARRTPSVHEQEGARKVRGSDRGHARARSFPPHISCHYASYAAFFLVCGLNIRIQKRENYNAVDL
jgi:hypothetical protein